MEQITLETVEPWLLSGKPVVRLFGKDFDQTPHEYSEYISTISEALGLPVATLVVAEPPAVVVQAYLPSTETPTLVDPLLKVTKPAFPWLYCVAPRCRNRVSVPGSVCESQHG